MDGLVLALAPVPLDVVAVALLAGLGIGVVLLALGCLLPATARNARPLWPILLTELVIVAAGLLPVLAGGRVLDAALFLLAFRVTREAAGVAMLRRIANATGKMRALPVVAGLVVAVVALVASGGSLVPVAVSGLGLLVPAGLVWMAVADRASPVRLMAEIIVFPVVPVVLFVAAARQGDQHGLLLLAFLLVETYDSYALLGGKLFGRHAVFPRLSPRKTVEGLATGGLMLTLTALALGSFVFGWSPLSAVLVAVLIATAAIVGDLAGSRLKRASGVKDYPPVLPRQGGLLDIVDAWLIAAPALVLLAVLAGPAQP